MATSHSESTQSSKELGESRREELRRRAKEHVAAHPLGRKAVGRRTAAACDLIFSRLKDDLKFLMTGRELARELDCCEGHAGEVLQFLRDLGVIVRLVTGGHHGPSIYQLTDQFVNAGPEGMPPVKAEPADEFSEWGEEGWDSENHEEDEDDGPATLHGEFNRLKLKAELLDAGDDCPMFEVDGFTGIWRYHVDRTLEITAELGDGFARAVGVAVTESLLKSAGCLYSEPVDFSDEVGTSRFQGWASGIEDDF